VAERTRELAIRSALGASSRQQVRDLVRYIVPALAGGAAAAALAIYLAFPFAAPFLFQVERIDPLAWTVGALLVAVFSAAAIVIPARRMIRLDAAAALRAS
jgi:ABC-type antimicrobial peptide transport system permease subunit